MTPPSPSSLLIVAGSGRSGTSLFTGMAHRLGLHVPQPEVSANRTNPRGFGEPRWAVDFDRRLLRSVDVRLEDARPSAWRHAATLAEQESSRAELRTWLGPQLDDADRVIVKDPHLTWLTDLYRHVSDDLGTSISMAVMLRHPRDTTHSRELAYGSTASPTSRLAAWLNVMLHLEVRTRDLPRALVRYEDLLGDWRAALRRADEALGVGLVARASRRQMADADALVDPTLRRAAGSWQELAVPAQLRDLAEDTWLTLGRLADGEQATTVHDDLDTLRESYVEIYRDARAIARSSVLAARAAERRHHAAPVAASGARTRSMAVARLRSSSRGVVRGTRQIAGTAKQAVGRRVRRTPARHRIHLLVQRVDEPGGVARSMITLANSLASRHDVEIISVQRHRKGPRFTISPQVEVSYLADVSAGPASRPSAAATARRLRTKLASLPPGVVVSNRPRLHLAVAKHAPASSRRIAVEHTAFAHRSAEVKAAIRRLGHDVDALVTMTDCDRRAYEQFLGPDGPTVVTVPNGVAGIDRQAANLQSTTISAAGSLVPNKGFDRLITAFAPLAAELPEWRLDIYGRGGERQALQDLIDRLDLQDHVRLHGFRPRFDRLVAESSIFALSSHYESFSLVILEAMAAGVPVVSFDCPTGPRSLIEDEQNGLLIPDGDVTAFTGGLRRLMTDPALRDRMGAAARQTSACYSTDAIAQRWERLFDQVTGRRRTRR